jgi:hypothetical protein
MLLLESKLLLVVLRKSTPFLFVILKHPSIAVWSNLEYHLSPQFQLLCQELQHGNAPSVVMIGWRIRGVACAEHGEVGRGEQ